MSISKEKLEFVSLVFSLMFPNFHCDNLLSTVRWRLSLVVAIVHRFGRVGILCLHLFDLLLHHQGKPSQSRSAWRRCFVLLLLAWYYWICSIDALLRLHIIDLFHVLDSHGYDRFHCLIHLRSKNLCGRENRVDTSPIRSNKTRTFRTTVNTYFSFLTLEKNKNFLLFFRFFSSQFNSLTRSFVWLLVYS